MGKYIKLFQNHSQYEGFTGTTDFVLPNVSWCRDVRKIVHYNPRPIYRTTSGETYCNQYNKYIDVYSQVSNDYGKTWETTATTPTLIEQNSYDCGYGVVEAKVNVTTTSSPTKILNRVNQFRSVEIDGVKQPSVTSGYTFSTTGEHTVKYELGNPSYIGNSAFTYCNNISKFVIPNTVTQINSDAFFGCDGITSIGPVGSDSSIEVPNSVINILDYAFYYCFQLRTVKLPDSVQYLGYQCFHNCRQLHRVEFGKGLTTINDSGFTACWTLTTIIFHEESKPYIGRSAFVGCSIHSLDIPSGCTSIWNNAFSGNSFMESIIIRKTTPPSLGSNVFYDTGSCPIQVPSGSVETYKAASGWSDYASRIQAIE